jgi:hypothetical protein
MTPSKGLNRRVATSTPRASLSALVEGAAEKLRILDGPWGEAGWRRLAEAQSQE